MKTSLLALLALFCISFVALAADATGTWKADIPGGRGPVATTFTLAVSGSTLTGTVDNGRGAIMIADGKVEGDTITFSTTVAGRDGTPNKQTYTGKVGADSIEFTREGGRGPVTFTAKK
ncbi:MAG TPA: hypothetical protein VGL82_06320 [Bryobacteraceae bacterium]|jgi:hypothetical protein